MAKADRDRDHERSSKKQGDDGRDREERKHRKREDDSVSGKSEKSDRRRHDEETGERRKKSEKERDMEQRIKQHDDAGDHDRESRRSNKVICNCCFTLNIFVLFLVLCNNFR